MSFTYLPKTFETTSGASPVSDGINNTPANTIPNTDIPSAEQAAEILNNNIETCLKNGNILGYQNNMFLLAQLKYENNDFHAAYKIFNDLRII